YLVRNTGNVTLTDVDVTDPAPGLSAITCPVGTLAPNATTTCTATYVTTQADVDRGSIHHTGTATGTAAAGTKVNNTSSATGPAVLTPCNTNGKPPNPPTSPTPNPALPNSYHVPNTGNVTLDPVTVTDPAPGLSTITCGVSALTPNESVTCTATRLTTQAD